MGIGLACMRVERTQQSIIDRRKGVGLDSGRGNIETNSGGVFCEATKKIEVIVREKFCVIFHS